MSGFLLTNGRTIDREATWSNVLDLEVDDVTTSELAIDSEIEHGEVACASLDLQLGPDRPDMLGSQRGLGPEQFTLIPRGPARLLLKRCIRVLHGHPPLKWRSTSMRHSLRSACRPLEPYPHRHYRSVGRGLTKGAIGGSLPNICQGGDERTSTVTLPAVAPDHCRCPTSLLPKGVRWGGEALVGATPSMTELSGYVLETLRKGGEFILYRGRQRGNPSSVLVLAPIAEQPAPASLRRLEHEYSLAAELDPAWAARPLALTRHEGRTILVLSDPGGEPMDGILDRGLGQPLELTRCLRVAIGLATAVGQVHRHGLIHKDIKPANVLVDDVGNVRLTRFGIASQLPHEFQAPAPPEVIAGTLAYMAPEQTGRMNRSIDARSDLYSLGVTLYQMLTGTLPFAAADPLEWIHCHIARQPTPPVERAAVPGPLSTITMTPLAKNAEERYQA